MGLRSVAVFGAANFVNTISFYHVPVVVSSIAYDDQEDDFLCIVGVLQQNGWWWGREPTRPGNEADAGGENQAQVGQGQQPQQPAHQRQVVVRRFDIAFRWIKTKASCSWRQFQTRCKDNDKATLDYAFGVFLTFTMEVIAISQPSSLSLDSSKATNAAASIFAVIDRELKIYPSDTSRRVLDIVKGDIELCHTSFKYSSRPDVQIFQDFNLFILAGERVLNLSLQHSATLRWVRYVL
ncbi:hypothetical protein Bca4012_035857 [Brassica carinata]